MIVPLALLLTISGPFESRVVAATGYAAGEAVAVQLERIPGHDLDGHPLLLQPEAAVAFRDLLEFAAKNGHYLAVNYAFRTQPQQKRLWRRSTALAARPGYSNHQLGLAIDITGTRVWWREKWWKTELYGFLRREAGRFGFVQPHVEEPWHWEFQTESCPTML